jgi:hypothetical protein
LLFLLPKIGHAAEFRRIAQKLPLYY